MKLDPTDFENSIVEENSKTNKFFFVPGRFYSSILGRPRSTFNNLQLKNVFLIHFENKAGNKVVN